MSEEAVIGIPLALFCLKVIATIFVALSLIIFLIYCLNEGASDAHVHFTILAYHILWVIAVIWFYELFPHYANIALFFVGLIFASVGSGMILLDAGCENTVHEWFGVLALIMAIISWLAGTILTFVVDEFTTNFVFLSLTWMTLFLASIALISGMVMDSGYADWASCFLLVLHIFIIIVYTLLSLAVVVYTLYVGGEVEAPPAETTTDALPG